MFESMHAYVLRNLEATKYRWGEVAAGTGMSKRTIEKIARKEIVDPGVSHVQKLHDYFRALEQGRAVA